MRGHSKQESAARLGKGKMQICRRVQFGEEGGRQGLHLAGTRGTLTKSSGTRAEDAPCCQVESQDARGEGDSTSALGTRGLAGVGPAPWRPVLPPFQPEPEQHDLPGLPLKQRLCFCKQTPGIRKPLVEPHPFTSHMTGKLRHREAGISQDPQQV